MLGLLLGGLLAAPALPVPARALVLLPQPGRATASRAEVCAVRPAAA